LYEIFREIEFPVDIFKKIHRLFFGAGPRQGDKAFMLTNDGLFEPFAIALHGKTEQPQFKGADGGFEYRIGRKIEEYAVKLDVF